MGLKNVLELNLKESKSILAYIMQGGGRHILIILTIISTNQISIPSKINKYEFI